MKSADAPPPSPTVRGKAAPKEGSGRAATPVEQALVNRFREALEAQGQTPHGDDASGQVLTDAAPVQNIGERHADDASGGESAHEQADLDGLADAGDLPSFGLSQILGPSGTTASAVAAASTGVPGYNAALVSQLMEKHVKQLLVSESSSRRDDKLSVMLNMTDAVLPGTQLTLTQTDAGWRLDSQSTSTASYRAIRDLAPELQARFAERGLGELTLDVNMREAT